MEKETNTERRKPVKINPKSKMNEEKAAIYACAYSVYEVMPHTARGFSPAVTVRSPG